MAELRSSKEFVPVYTAQGQLAGEMIRLLLESVNIPAIISQESAGIAFGLTVGPLGEVIVLVPAGRAEEAREVLRAMENGQLAQTFYPGKLLTYPVYKNNKMTCDEIIKDVGSDDL